MRKLPPLNALKAFEAAGRHQNLGAAAKELFVTHGAVSKQVKQLERILGIQLTRRTRTGLVLTPEGQRLMPKLTEAMDCLSAAINCIDEETKAGSVKMACMPAFTVNWLIPRLDGFRSRFPDIELSIVPAHGEDPVADTNIDLAILYGRPKWPTRKIERLSQLELFPVCSPALMNGANPIRRPVDLAHHLLIDSVEGDHWREWSALNGFQYQNANRALRFDDFNHCITSARLGLGVTMGDNITTATDLRRGTLVRPLLESLRPETKAYYLVTSATKPLTDSTSIFIDWVFHEVERANDHSQQPG